MSHWYSHVPLPHEPWNRVAPSLWVGGCDYDQDNGTWAAGRIEGDTPFDLVITLWSGWDPATYGPDPDSGISHLHIPFPDGPLTHESINAVAAAVWHTTRAIQGMQRVLVRCQAGLNRSGLVVAIVLVQHYGFTPEDAVAHLRKARSQWSLCNPDFEAYVLAL